MEGVSAKSAGQNFLKARLSQGADNKREDSKGKAAQVPRAEERAFDPIALGRDGAQDDNVRQRQRLFR